MTLHQLRIFLAVAQSTTLTRASKLLGLAQPSLSQQLARPKKASAPDFSTAPRIAWC
jgi:DNA-binding transcriptional LysR family regulator